MGAAAAGISAVGSILGGITGGKGAKKAAKLQSQAYEKGIAEQRRQFDVTQQNFAPYLAAGQRGIASYLDLLGLNGGETQAAAIEALKGSPQFTSLYDTGADTILQNASATGGLRGGNTQGSLAQFGSGLLNQVIQQQLGNYGGLISTGSGSTNSLGQLGAQNSSQISNLLGQQGQAQAQGAAGQAAAWQSAINGLTKIGSNFASGQGW